MRAPNLPSFGLAAFWVLSLGCWLALNLLAAIGFLALLLMLLANATWTGFFRETGNLAAHFLAAPPAAQAAFERLVLGLILTFAFLLCLTRFPSLRAALRAPDSTAPN